MKKIKLRKQVKEFFRNCLMSLAIGIFVFGSFCLVEFRYSQLCESGNTYYCASTWSNDGK